MFNWEIKKTFIHASNLAVEMMWTTTGWIAMTFESVQFDLWLNSYKELTDRSFMQLYMCRAVQLIIYNFLTCAYFISLYYGFAIQELSRCRVQRISCNGNVLHNFQTL